LDGLLGSIEVNKVLCFSPHSDDAEILAGGTLAMWASQGVEVILCVVTNGAMGSNDPAVKREDLIATRRREQRNAAAILGIAEVVFLGHEDGFVEDSHELRIDMIREIRRHRPDVVIGPDPALYYFDQWYVNHPDHRSVGEAFLAAVNPGATTVPLYRSALYDRGFEPHQVKACLLAASPNQDCRAGRARLPASVVDRQRAGREGFELCGRRGRRDRVRVRRGVQASALRPADRCIALSRRCKRGIHQL
jgi:LmbE family N-acetylglucosaminyl deacetylase